MFQKDRLTRYFLYLTVFMTGMAVLVVEVTAVRILSPYFGSSLFVLSSVLSIILGALSLGYYIGGKISDMMPYHAPLYTIIVAGGITVLFSELLAVSTLPSIGPAFSIITGPMIFSVILFFVPAFLFGIVSPYVIKLQSLNTDESMIGSVVGATFFWGTLGSILGSLFSGFVFIPLIGIKESVIGTGLATILLGLIGYFVLSYLEKDNTKGFWGIVKSKWHVLFIVFALSTFLFVLISAQEGKSPFKKVLLDTEGYYSQILVYEEEHLGGTIRALKRDTNNSSASYVDSNDLIFEYTQFAEFYEAVKPDTDSFLLIGGGAYSIPRTITSRDPDVVVDVSEIEPSLFDVAQEYFGLDDVSRINNYVIDGRVFLERSDKKYDVIFGDAFGTDYGIPSHLATYEFFKAVRDHLEPEGVFMLNHIGTVEGDRTPTLTGSLLKTIIAIFPNTKVFALERTNPRDIQNIVVVSRNGDDPIEFPNSYDVRDPRGVRTKNVGDLEVPLETYVFEEEVVFTDNNAPIELLMLKQ